MSKTFESLIQAIKKGHTNLAITLAKVLKDDASSEDNCALRMASLNGRLEVVKELLKLDNVREQAHIRDNDALEWASECGHSDVVKELLKLDNVRKAANNE